MKMEPIDDYELFDKNFPEFIRKGREEQEFEAADTGRESLSGEVLRG